MGKKKTGHRALAAITASIMLLSSITANAAQPPVQAQQPKWQDVFDLMDYVGQNYYEQGSIEYLETDDVSPELPYYEPGTLLGSAPKEQIYAAYMEGDGTFSERNHEDGENSLTGDASSEYADFYAAGISLVDSLKTATGTKYIDDMVGAWERFWTEKDEPLWAKIENGQIIIVDSEENAPDISTMDKGTYWVLESDLDTYGSTVDYENSAWKTWDEEGLWEAHNGGPDISRADFQNCMDTVTSAYNTLLGKLHEGTKESPAPDNSLTAADSSSSSSSGKSGQTQEHPAPAAIVNEVAFSNGSKSRSSLEGIYCNTFVSGAVYSDGQEKIKQAAGLSEEEIKNGTVIKYYICSSLNKAINESLSQAVSAQEYQVLGILQNDLYRLNKGDIHPIKTTSEALTVILGVPSYLQGGQYEFIVLCYDEKGNLVVFKDTDTDNSTVTVQAKSFGYWAVGYRNKQ